MLPTTFWAEMTWPDFRRADMGRVGAAGEADRASAAKGEAAADFGVERFVALLRDGHAFGLSRLTAAPLGSIR